MLGISTTNARVGGFRGGISAEAKTIYNRIIADGGVSNLTRLNFFVKGLKAIYGDLANVPVCYDAHWIGYKLGSGTGATAGQAAAKLYSIKNTENLLTFSEEFDNAAWTKNSSTITPNATIAPNGTLTADKLIDTASSAQHWAFQSTTNTLTSATISCYMKKGERNWGVIRTRTTINDYFAWFNLDNGTLGTVESGITASITDAGNGWYRCIVVNPNPTTSANPSIIGLSNANNVTTYTGDGTSGIFVWGAQFNTGSVALPYTQTTTTAQTLADAVQSTAASQPLLLSHNGDNYWYGSGVSGNYCSTPNASANQITGDIEIIARVKITNPSTTQTIIAKNVDGSNFSYWFGIGTPNNLRLIFSQNGIITITATSTVAQPFSTTDIGYVKVTRTTSDGIVKFFTSTDGITYTQLGANVASTSGAMFNGNASVKIGAYDTANLFPFFGSIYRATISNSIGGAPVVDFNPAIYNASTSQTAWTSTTGEIWTINTGTATTGYKGVLVDRTIVMSDGVDDRLFSSAVTVNQPDTIYVANKLFDLSGNNYIFDGDGLNRQAMFANQTIFANLSLNTAASVGTLIHLTTGVVNGLTSTIDVNNVLSATGATGTNNLGGLYLFSRQSGTFGMTSIRTFIISNSADNSTVRTATYNLIRSLNNNAF